MHWIKEVEITSSIGDLMTSRSITGRRDFSDYDMHHECALPKKSKCRRAMCSKIRPILTREADCLHDLWPFPCNRSLWSCTRSFRSNSMYAHSVMTFKISIQVGTKLFTEMALESVYKSKRQDSVQLETVLALYEQEIIRNHEPPSYSRLKTTATRNFRARSEIVERGAVTKSQKGRKATVRKVWEGYQWKAIGQCSKGDSWVTIQRLDTETIKDKQDNRPVLRQKRRRRPTEKPLNKVQAAEEKVLLEQEGRFRADISFRRRWTGSSCNYWHPPMCLNSKSESGCKNGEKVVWKDQLLCWRSLYNWVVCLKILIRENVLSRKKGNWDQTTPSTSPRARDTTSKIGKERVHREELSKSVNLMSVVLALPDLRKEHKTKLCNKKDAPAE